MTQQTQETLSPGAQIRQTRIQKLTDLADKGVNPYPYVFDKDANAADLQEKYKDYEFVGAMSGNKLFDEELANESRDNLQIFKHNPKMYWRKRLLKDIEKEERKEQVRRLRFFQANQWIVDSLDINLDSLKSTLGIMDLDSLEL